MDPDSVFFVVVFTRERRTLGSLSLHELCVQGAVAGERWEVHSGQLRSGHLLPESKINK